MKRSEIIQVIGKEYLTTNIENDEFSYDKAFKEVGKKLSDYYDRSKKLHHKFLDIRFEDDKLCILVETKPNFDKCNKIELYEQLESYVKYEAILSPAKKIVAIIANTNDDRIKVFYDLNKLPSITENEIKVNETKLKSFNEYRDIFYGVKNDKEKVIRATYELNEKLHALDVPEKIRSQFVGSCLLALKYGLVYQNCKCSQIRQGITEILEKLLDKKDINKATKIAILKKNVIDSQNIRNLDRIIEKKVKVNGELKIIKSEERNFEEILNFIKCNILPFINDKNTAGQDILNLFFTTFNKYVGKADKNQAFTPDHIVKFMSKVVNVNKNSYVLDPCAGSGTFCVRALTDAMNDCESEKEKNQIKQHHIHGIEYSEDVYGLLTTNMLIHGDGNSQMRQGSCFDVIDEILDNFPIDTILMNPPYNATRNQSNPEYVKYWDKKTKIDPSKGFHFVHFIANKINKKGKLACLLPVPCAIGNDKEILKFKELMLENHQLEAVFSLPNEVFYPGASVCSCCMIFNLGEKHFKIEVDNDGRTTKVPKKPTFFGYFKDDGFAKKKNLGRIEIYKNNKSLWSDIEKEWFHLYQKKISKPGLSVVKEVDANDEWLPEAYMETDYSKLQPCDFEQTVKEYFAYEIKYSLVNKDKKNGE